jgi:hypothetical protein
MGRTGTEGRRDRNARRMRNAADGRHPLGLLVEQLTRRTEGVALVQYPLAPLE